MAESVKRNDKIAAMLNGVGPGPAGVKLPPLIGFVDHDKTKRQMPAYSLGLKTKSVFSAGTSGPGPIYGIATGLTAKGLGVGPAYTLRMRTKIHELGEVSPGPAAYLPEINVNRWKAPEYSLISRRGKDHPPCSPGPIYMLPSTLGPNVVDKKSASAYTMFGKGKVHPTLASPGPIYDIGRPDVIKPRAGEVSLKGDRKTYKIQQYSAGPASYDLASCKNWRQSPAYSLRIRHSPIAGVMLTECDKLVD